MRTTKYSLFTKRINTLDIEETISYKLMLSSGMIRRVASGIYTWLPTGIRVLKKIEHIVRNEMNRINALEILMPIVQPAHLWQESNRLEQYGPELLRLKDRNKRLFVLGPTHEEIVTELIKNELSSYKELPLILYQIQTKFRDEIRPRCGVVRAREFIMKDAYSFHWSKQSLQETYDNMYDAYSRIFNYIGLNFRVVQADSGSIGGSISHEFHVLSNSGEDNIIFSSKSNYAANLELAKAITPIIENVEPIQTLYQIETPNVKNILHITEQFNLSIKKTIKTLIVKGKNNNTKLVALLIRGDHELNTRKAEKIDIIASPLIFATEEEIRLEIGAGPGSIGPIGLNIPIIADLTVAKMKNFIAGANIDGKHYIGINWERDLPLTKIADIRNVVEGDLSPDGKGIINIQRSIEVGHIFQLGTKYSKLIKAYIQDKHNYNKPIIMGCYGIGITRILASIIEQNYDKNGIIWPQVLAPFEIAIIPINMHKSCLVKDFTEMLYNELSSKGVDVIIDDRIESPGVMFSDIELIGIPNIVIVSEHNLNKEIIEYKSRITGKKQIIPKNHIINFVLKELIKK
ncbi:MAG: proline--tRNA ligase [Pantoea sp. Brub]|nr:proline--tRNA ligase [Pantoea sp. Brub]